ncbi:MAG: hypothetical protein M3424_02025 [Actinomycetota bacterium]|nr:hypothetical protein [Actinomycetota bacterium]
MSEQFIQRELRNDSGRIMRALDDIRSFVVSRHGQPVGEPPRCAGDSSSMPAQSLRSSATLPPSTGSGCVQTWTPVSSRIHSPVAEQAPRGLLDISVVIDLELLGPEQLPEQIAVSAVTMAELAAEPTATSDIVERWRRQDRPQRAEAAFDPLPFGGEGCSGVWPRMSALGSGLCSVS